MQNLIHLIFNLYFDAIKTIKPVSPEAMKELGPLSKTDKRTFDKIVGQNYKLVMPVAKRCTRGWILLGL
jgi:hypothetical protein